MTFPNPNWAVLYANLSPSPQTSACDCISLACSGNPLHSDSVAGLVTAYKCYVKQIYVWNEISEGWNEVSEGWNVFISFLGYFLLAEHKPGSLCAPQVLRACALPCPPRGHAVVACGARFSSSFNYISALVIAGGDLHYHLSQHGVFSEKEMRFYATEIILGLEHMHNRFVVYRDLKVMAGGRRSATDCIHRDGC